MSDQFDPVAEAAEFDDRDFDLQSKLHGGLLRSSPVLAA
jgi:hypothetical protein